MQRTFQERQMRTLYAAIDRAPWPALSRDLRALILFCVLGLTISVAVFSRLDPDAADFIINNLQ
jgi:hypothetical protein